MTNRHKRGGKPANIEKMSSTWHDESIIVNAKWRKAQASGLSPFTSFIFV
jgi:hypothetical protein